jgi:hypothetical protein
MAKLKFVLLTMIFLFSMLSCSPRFEYAILSNGVIPSNGTLSTLSVIEIEQIEEILKDCLPELNRGLQKYKYQYVPYSIENREKLVWVNAFCSKEAEYWKEDPVLVLDGGDCYFNLIINLSKRECQSLIINGKA